MNHDCIAIIILIVWFSMGILANVLVILETIKRKEELPVKALFLSITFGLFLAPIFLWCAFDFLEYKFVIFIKRKWDGFWNYKIIKGKK